MAAGPRSRPRSSQDTRAAILAAARARFAADGYERATVRAIARDAAIDASMIIRYYGSKEALFAAASEFDLAMPDLAGLPPQEVGAALVRHFLERWEQDTALVALLRTGMTNDTVAQRLRELFAAQLRPAVESVAPPGTHDQRAALVAGQMLGLAVTRYILRLPPVVDLTVQEVVAWLGPTVQRYLTATAP